MERKSYFWLALALILFFYLGPVAAQSMGNFKPGTELSGFRGLEWATDFSAVEREMVFTAEDSSYGGMQQYTRNKDHLTIGRAKLDRIIYAFWRGKLASVEIFIKGSVNWVDLKRATFEKFGEGFQSNKDIEDYFWSGNISSMLLEYNKISNIGSLYIRSEKMFHQMEQYSKEKAKQGVEEGF